MIMAIKKRTHPKFLRPNYGRTSRSRIKIAWRRPRGIDNKKRLKIAYMGASPSIGYGQPSAIKHFHPAGMRETLVQSPSDLTGLKGVLVRIAGSVGRKKREIIERIAKEMKLRVLNPAHERKSDKARKENKAKKIAELSKKSEPKKVEAAKPAAATAEAAKPAPTAAPAAQKTSEQKK
jgi:large subunit ribosomal protein L32e